MEVWQYIAAAVLGNAAVLAVLGWLGKALLDKLLQRDSKRFEVELHAKANSTIEELKSELQLRVVEHEVRFSRLHEKRATVIADLYAHLVEALWEAESFLSPMEWNGEPSKQEKHRRAMGKLLELYRYFDKHRIYLPEALCCEVEKLTEDMRTHVTHFGVYVGESESSLPYVQKEKREAWLAGWDAIKNQIPAARKKLEDEFRALLGAGKQVNRDGSNQ